MHISHAPREVLDDICLTLNLPNDCGHILYSNAKPNIALSVRQLQHPDGSFADLVTLIPKHAKDASDIPLTLIYANSRVEVEEMQDFLRRHLPAGIPGDCVEFYHRYVSDERKDVILFAATTLAQLFPCHLALCVSRLLYLRPATLFGCGVHLA